MKIKKVIGLLLVLVFGMTSMSVLAFGAEEGAKPVSIVTGNSPVEEGIEGLDVQSSPDIQATNLQPETRINIGFEKLQIDYVRVRPQWRDAAGKLWWGGVETTARYYKKSSVSFDLYEAERNRQKAYVEAQGGTFCGWVADTGYTIVTDDGTGSSHVIVERRPVASRTSTRVGFSGVKTIAVGTDATIATWDGYLEYFKQKTLTTAFNSYVRLTS